MNITPPNCEQLACLPKVELFLDVGEGNNHYRIERCGSHGKDRMESGALKRCKKPGCDMLESPNVESTREGFPSTRYAKYGCTDEGCKTEAMHVVEAHESKTAESCLMHPKPQQRAVSSRSCLQPGCSNQAVIDLHRGGEAVLCAQHTVDRSAKASVRRCPERGCRKHRNFGNLTLNLAEFCLTRQGGDGRPPHQKVFSRRLRRARRVWREGHEKPGVLFDTHQGWPS